MKHNNSSILTLKTDIPSELSEMAELSPLQPFSGDVALFFNALSKKINSDPRTRSYPDVATFAFFCRKSNINRLKKQFYNKDNIRLGRGLVFHVTPSNVPVNFAYSLLMGLIAGNSNIVKIPSKKFEQIDIISEAIDRIAEDDVFPNVSKRIKLVLYERSDDVVTEKLSGICDVRIIWGGDETIRNIRKHKIPARSIDIAFADRYSLCVINADAFVNERDPEIVAEGFFNDTYLFDQNACTSPHLVVWLGTKDNVGKSKEIFWKELHKIAEKQYVFSPVRAVDKLSTFYDHSITSEQVSKVKTDDNLLWRIELDNLEKGVENYRSNCGYFLEYHTDSLEQILEIVNQRYQTMSHYGVSLIELQSFIMEGTPKGIDRIVPIGRTMDFSFIWDGYDLIEICTRHITLT